MAWTITEALNEMVEQQLSEMHNIDAHDSVKAHSGPHKGKSFTVSDHQEMHPDDHPKGFNPKKHLLGQQKGGGSSGDKHHILDPRHLKKHQEKA
jgi:hypothetical protein